MTETPVATIPNAALDMFDLGSREFVAENNDAALEYFDRAIATYEAYADAHYMRGLTLLRLGRTQDGVAALESAAQTTENPILRGYAQRKIANVTESAGG
jgi:tetratricopeptide (TPR) repeat protein